MVDNYNHERFLGAAIDSALAQAYPHLQVIVVDDGSTDRSRDVIAGYGDRITAVLNDNGGQASAFNAGFARSRGEVVIFLDADDLLAPTATTTAVQELGRPGVVAVHWPLWEIDAGGGHLGVYPPWELSRGDLRKGAIARGPWAYRTSTGATGSAWSRPFLESIMPMPAELRGNADAYPWFLATVAGTIAAVEQPQGSYRFHDRNRFGGPRPLDERLSLHRAAYTQQCALMSAYLTRQGIAHEPAKWRGHDSPWHRFDWLEQGQQVIRELAAPGERFIILDEDEWAAHWLAGGIVEGRHPLPFLERDGELWGYPEDGNHAVRELERMREEGSRVLFVGSSVFWVFDCYPEFGAHLRCTYPVAHSSEHLLAFDLTESAGQQGGAENVRTADANQERSLD